LHTIRSIWADSNSRNHIWVTETAGHNWNHLGKLEAFHADLHTRHVINIWANYNSPNKI